MERNIRESAFAKLNLSLDVLSRRPDGYHDMSMVMQSVSLCDDVDITVIDGGEKGIKVDISKSNLPKDLHNLAGKAAEIFLNYVNKNDLHVEVYITKRIPDRAGMAGGSSDAAAVIRGLDKLLGTRLSDRELYRLCLDVGSDVPFCLYGGTALAQGRGEILTDLAPFPECGILIVKPDFSVSTPELFCELDRLGLVKMTYTDRLLSALASEPLGIGGKRGCYPLGNVFKTALTPPQRDVVEGIEMALLDRGAVSVNMTGTGSAVFGIYPTMRDARAADLSRYGETFTASPVGKLKR